MPSTESMAGSQSRPKCGYEACHVVSRGDFSGFFFYVSDSLRDLADAHSHLDDESHL